MTTLGLVTVVGVVVLAVLLWFFLRARTQDGLSAMMEKRRATAQLVSRAEYVEGMSRMPVAMALAGDSLYYENADLEASLELSRIDDVIYDDELATGKSLEADASVLRLRSHGTTFEFVLPKGDMPKWQAALPARRIGTPPAARVG